MENIKIWLIAAATLLFIGAIITGTFSGLVFPDADCEWTAVEAENGETFSSLDELEQHLGAQEYNELIEEIESSESLDIRDPSVGSVEWQRCVISQ